MQIRTWARTRSAVRWKTSRTWRSTATSRPKLLHHTAGHDRFNVELPDLFTSLKGDLIPPPDRLAEIYIFAWHGETREAVADHKAPEQWRLPVVPAKRLGANLRSIGLDELKEIADIVGFESLAKAVRETLDGL